MQQHHHLVEFILLALACAVTGSVAVVVRLNFVAWRHAPSRRSGLLPLHVWLVAVAHLLFVTGTGLSALEGFQTDRFTSRFYMYIVGSVCTIISLVAVARHMRNRRTG